MNLEISLKAQILSATGEKMTSKIQVQNSEFSANPGDANSLNPGCVDLIFDAGSGSQVTLRMNLEALQRTLELIGENTKIEEPTVGDGGW